MEITIEINEQDKLSQKVLSQKDNDLEEIEDLILIEKSKNDPLHDWEEILNELKEEGRL